MENLPTSEQLTGMGIMLREASTRRDAHVAQMEGEIARLVAVLDSIARLAAKLPQDGPGGEILTLACTGLIKP